MNEKLAMEWQCVLRTQRPNCIPGCMKKHVASMSREVIHPCPLQLAKISPEVLHPALESSV